MKRLKPRASSCQPVKSLLNEVIDLQHQRGPAVHSALQGRDEWMRIFPTMSKTRENTALNNMFHAFGTFGTGTLGTFLLQQKQIMDQARWRKCRNSGSPIQCSNEQHLVFVSSDLEEISICLFILYFLFILMFISILIICFFPLLVAL